MRILSRAGRKRDGEITSGRHPQRSGTNISISWPPSLKQALRDVARDAEDTAEAVDVALNTRIAEMNEAKARLTEKDGMVSLGVPKRATFI